MPSAVALTRTGRSARWPWARVRVSAASATETCWPPATLAVNWPLASSILSMEAVMTASSPGREAGHHEIGGAVADSSRRRCRVRFSTRRRPSAQLAVEFRQVERDPGAAITADLDEAEKRTTDFVGTTVSLRRRAGRRRRGLRQAGRGSGRAGGRNRHRVRRRAPCEIMGDRVGRFERELQDPSSTAARVRKTGCVGRLRCGHPPIAASSDGDGGRIDRNLKERAAMSTGTCTTPTARRVWPAGGSRAGIDGDHDIAPSPSRH